MYICEGEGTHIIDLEPYPVQAGSCYFISKYQTHFWQLTKPLKGYALLFPEEFLDSSYSNLIKTHDLAFFQRVEHSPLLNIDKENHTRIHRLFEDIEHEYHIANTRSISVLRSYLHILLTQLYRLYIIDHRTENLTETSLVARQFRKLVAEHFISKHAVQDYAALIGVTTNHLIDTVTAVTGHSPGYIIRQKLLLEAKRILVHTNSSAAEIAYRLHFDDASYFGRFFKRETGISPIAFRQKMRKKYHISLE